MAASKPSTTRDGQDQVEILLVPVGRLAGRVARHARSVSGAATQLDAGFAQSRGDHGQEAVGHRAIHQQRLQRVAHARRCVLALCTIVVAMSRSARRPEHVHQALVVLEDGNARVLGHPAHEVLAAPRDDEIDQAVLLDIVAHRGPVGDLHELDASEGGAGLLHGLGQHRGDERVGLDGLAAAAQHDGVADFTHRPAASA
jgi:hypothetical protein